MQKKILFVGPGYGNYDIHIKTELAKYGEVEYFCFAYMDFYHPRLLSILYKLHLIRIVKQLNNRYISYSIDNLKLSCFDKVFILKGDYLTETHMIMLKNAFPNATFVLYLWDDIGRIEFSKGFFEHFDKVLSFDLEDCKKYGFIHRPLFYLKRGNVKQRSIDLSFVGTNHSIRLRWLKTIKQMCNKVELSYSIHLIISRTLYLKERFLAGNLKKDDNDILCFNPVRYNDYLKILEASKAIVDFPFPTQSGLTMRTIVALSNGVKVITTNGSIREYDDIPESMYYVLNEANLNAMDLKAFINSETNGYILPETYSLDAFVKEIIN